MKTVPQNYPTHKIRQTGPERQSRTPFWRCSLPLTALLAAGCSDILTPGGDTLTTANLLILAQQPGAPAPAEGSFYVVNSRVSTHSVVHPDQFNNSYLTVRFPGGCVSQVGGLAVGAADSAVVTVRPRQGSYGMTLLPDDLTLTDSCGATATFTFGRYGDLSVADRSSTYLDRAAYAAALNIWREISPTRWQVVPGSGPSGNDAVTGMVQSGGMYVLAAPR